MLKKSWMKNILSSLGLSLLALSSINANEPSARLGERVAVKTDTMSKAEQMLINQRYAKSEEQPFDKPSDESSTQEKESFDLSYQIHSYPFAIQIGTNFTQNGIEMADGAAWQVSGNVSFWSPLDRLIITQNSSWFSAYDYKIYNEDKNQFVEAKLFMWPFVDRSLMITYINPEYRTIQLSDGSLWKITSADDFIYFNRPGSLSQRCWEPKDLIIVGGNDEYFGSITHPFILINTNVNKFVRAQQIY